MPGTIAGTSTVHGYRQIRIDGVIYRAHRLAWAYMNGAFPVHEIDHRNRIRDDNRIANLRDVSAEINRQNQGIGSQRNDSAGVIGATLHRRSGLYQAQIKVGGKHHSLGYYKTPEEAHAAYVNAKRAMHPGCAI